MTRTKPLSNKQRKRRLIDLIKDAIKLNFSVHLITLYKEQLVEILVEIARDNRNMFKGRCKSVTIFNKCTKPTTPHIQPSINVGESKGIIKLSPSDLIDLNNRMEVIN